MTLERWLRTMDQFGLGRNEPTYDWLKENYRGPTRAYHNFEHVEECLDRLERFDGTVDKAELELAIWFHDVIYQSLATDNELKSAQAAVDFLESQEASPLLAQRVFDLIMATIHRNPPSNEREALIMDIDIAILGSDEQRYKKYCHAIREEYKVVPWELYKSSRRELLLKFLQRDRLFYTDYFFERLESKARKNLAEEIEELKEA